MPADWALGSVVVAIIALIISREPRLTMLMRTVIATCLQWLRPEWALCDSAVWDYLPNVCFHSHRNCSPNAPGHELFSKLSDTHSTENFFQYFSTLNAYQKKRVVKKPHNLDLMRKYFHTDVKTLLMCCMSTIDSTCIWQFYHDAYSNSYTFMFGKSFLVLKRHANYFEADVHAPCWNCDIVTRRTNIELERIILSGAPPWYQETLENKYGVTFSFPEPNARNMARAGWIIAIGLGDATALPYFATSFGDFRPLSPRFHHRGPGKGSYWEGCQYLQRFVYGQIGKAFRNLPENELVQDTNRALKAMLKAHTGTNTSELLKGTRLEGANLKGQYTARLDASDIEFAIDMFNSLDLNDSDTERLRGIILPILAGSLRGLHKVLQHLKSGSFQLRGNFNDVVVKNFPVFLGH